MKARRNRRNLKAVVGKHRVWLDNKSLQLAMDCGGYYSDSDDAIIMGPKTRHKYADELLKGCIVRCAKCDAQLWYEDFYRCKHCAKSTANKVI